MATKRFKKLFLLRFIAYFCTLFGLIFIILELGPVINAEYKYRIDSLLGVKHTLGPQIVSSSGTVTPQPHSSSNPDDSQATQSLGQGSSSEQLITPVSTEYGIVIEKIDANARIIPQVDPANSKEYIEALSKGVAEAKGSTPPGQPGNTFLFSHSTDAPWNIARYNAIFYLLRELDKGDKVIVFYQGRRYDYIVFDKTIAKADDVSFLANRYDKPVLTLQTCDPPGTVLNRLIVRAKLQST